jgi:hypothetical protein
VLLLRIFKTSLIVSGLVISAAQGAPCCGGSSLLPSLITGDDRAQVTLSLTHDRVVADAFSTSPARERASDNQEQTSTARVSGSYLFSDLWQTGVDVPIVYRTRAVADASQSAAGLGDVGLQVGYEYLPQRAYSAWRPKGFVFLRGMLPTGRSIYESDDPGGPDNIGKGFYSLALGSALTRSWGMWDAWLWAEGHWYLPRTFESPTGPSSFSVSRHFSSGWGASGLLGVGASPGMGNFRIGLFVSPIYESDRTVTMNIVASTGAKWVWNTGVQASYLFSDEWSTTLTYTDQTILGHAYNNSLSRSISLLLQRRFPL